MINTSAMDCHSQLFCHIFDTEPEPVLELRLTLIIELIQFHGWYVSFSPLGFIFTGLLWPFSLLVQTEINVFACCSRITIHNNPKLNFTQINSLASKIFPAIPYTFKNKQDIFLFTVTGIHFYCRIIISKLCYLFEFYINFLKTDGPDYWGIGNVLPCPWATLCYNLLNQKSSHSLNCRALNYSECLDIQNI